MQKGEVAMGARPAVIEQLKQRKVGGTGTLVIPQIGKHRLFPTLPF
jgi:hypothetical protein